MPIKQITPMSEVDAYFDEWMKREEFKMIRQLAYIGEQCINKARTLPSPPVQMRGQPHTPNYIDDTGNLRSSIGYVIAKDGEIIQISSFDTIGYGKEGARDGAAFAHQLVSEFPKGIVLIVVAGMNYAAYVSAKGYDVLDSAELVAERLITNLKKQLGFTKR